MSFICLLVLVLARSSVVICELFGEDVPYFSSPIVSLEHVNINSGGMWNATFENFYFNALGFVYDPRAATVLARQQAAGGTTEGLMWVNIGLQQIHLPSDEAQKVRGHMELQYKNLSEIVKRLHAVGVSYKAALNDEKGIEYVETLCPVGNVFRLLQQQPDKNAVFSLDNTENVSANAEFSWLGPRPHIAPGSEVSLPGGVSTGLGMSAVVFDVPHNTAVKICAFYDYVFHTHSEVITSLSGVRTCVVTVGYRQTLRYTELYAENTSAITSNPTVHTTTSTDSTTMQESRTQSCVASASANTAILPAYDGHHIAIYVRNFVDIYHRLVALNLIYENPRFPQFQYRNLEDVLHYNEFRLINFIDFDTNQTIYQLEHEIRSVDHPSFCCKKLVGEDIVAVVV